MQIDAKPVKNIAKVFCNAKLELRIGTLTFEHWNPRLKLLKNKKDFKDIWFVNNPTQMAIFMMHVMILY